MALMTYSKKGISAIELLRKLGHSRHNTIWSLIHRIRGALGKGDALYGLEELIKFDEGYFERATSEKEQKKLKRGNITAK